MASREARTFVLAAVGLVAVAAMFVWALAAPPTPEALPALPTAPAPLAAPPATEPAAPPPAAPVAPAATTQAAQPVPGVARDPNAIDLFAGAMPEWMQQIHDRAAAGKSLDVEEEKQLFNFGQEHKDDARPQILLAWDSMNRNWWGFAVRLYKAAYEADPRAKEDPTMLRDLVEIASRYDTVEYRESVELIKTAFGEEALPRIDMKLEEVRRSGDVTRATRLERLRSTITER